MRKNQFFKVPLADASGRELTAAELELQVERIIQMAGDQAAAPVGALTSENRDVWADVSVLVLLCLLLMTCCVYPCTLYIHS